MALGHDREVLYASYTISHPPLSCPQPEQALIGMGEQHNTRPSQNTDPYSVLN